MPTSAARTASFSSEIAATASPIDDPLQHPHVLAEARPHEVAVIVLTEPVDAEDAWRRGDVLAADAQPMLPILRHVVTAERQHGHRVPTQLADLARRHRPDQGLPVTARFNRRIALDLRAQVVVSRLVEPEVVHTDLRRDALLRSMCFRKQRHLHRGRQVQNVQQCIEAARQFHGHARRLETGVGGTNRRMLRQRDGVAVLRPGLRLVIPDRRRVLAMRDDDDRRMLEYPLQRHRVVDEHVAGRCPHECFYAAGLTDLEVEVAVATGLV